MKKVLVPLTFISLLFIIPLAKADISPLHIDGQFWYDENNNPVFLRGVIYIIHNEGSGNIWTNYNADEIDDNLDLIKETGFNFVGIHVGMPTFMSGPDQYNSARFDYLKDFLQRCKDKGLYVLIRSPDWAGQTGWVYENWRTSDFVFDEDFIKQQEWFLHNVTKAILDSDTQDVMVGFDLWTEAEKIQNFRGVYDKDESGPDTSLDNSAVLAKATPSWQDWLRSRYGTVENINNFWTRDPVALAGNYVEQIATSDNKVSNAIPDTVVGGGTYSKVEINPSSSDRERLWVKFPTEIPSGKTFLNATLYLYRTDDYPTESGLNRDIYVQRATDDSWDETTITWNNAPRVSLTGPTATFQFTQENTWHSVNVTDQVLPEVGGDNIVTLRLWDANENGVYHRNMIRTKDSTLKPYLRIYYDGANGGEIDFSDIPFPTESQLSSYQSPRKVDYAKFMIEHFYNLTKRRRDAAKKYYPFDVTGSISGFVYNDMAGDHMSQAFLTPELIADIVDFISNDPYRIHRGEIVTMATYNRRWNKPMLAMEYGARTERTYPGGRMYTQDEAKTFWSRSYSRELSQGVAASLIWFWQEPASSDWSYGFGIVNSDGSDKQITPYLKELNLQTRNYEQYIDGALYDPEIAILFSMTSKINDRWGLMGQASLLPMAFALRNIYPYSVYEGPSRTYWDETLFKTDTDLNYINQFDILAYDYIHYQHTNCSWWDTYLNRSVQDHGLKLIAQGLPAQDGKGGMGDDEYADECSIDWKSWFPVSDFGSTAFQTSGEWYDTNGVFLWGPFKGDSWFSYSFDGQFASSPTLNVGSTPIGTIDIGGITYTWMVANDKVFFFATKYPEARMFSIFNTDGLGEGGSLDSYYTLDEQKKILTALSWFNYTPKFNVSNKYVLSQVFDRENGVMVIFSNEWSSSQSFTFYLNSLTDYELDALKTYKLYWAHNWTTVSGTYSGSDLQNGISLTLNPHTVGVLMIYEEKLTPYFLASNSALVSESWSGNKLNLTLMNRTDGTHRLVTYSPTMDSDVKINFGNGTIVDAENYWNSETKLITVDFDF